MIRSLVLFAFATTLGLAASAQVTLHYREGQRIDPADVQRILEQDGAIRTRSIRLLASLPDSAAASPAAAVAAATPSGLSLPVQFQFDSATILPGAQEQLDALAEGIKRLPGGRSVVIEGHTDATGSDEYNQSLSRRRAAAVKQYLVQHHGIDARRLRDVGRGERQPVDGRDPGAPENRRVEFRGG
jgi:outer membrane protein OmpA-like peptidoglycan-associated protein